MSKPVPMPSIVLPDCGDPMPKVSAPDGPPPVPMPCWPAPEDD